MAKVINNEDIMKSQQLAGRVVRWHTWPMIHKPTVREHAGGVAVIYVRLFGMPRAEVLYYCLVHDDGELSAGDTPYGAKRRVPELADAVNKAETMGLLTLGITLPELTEAEWLQFKLCDLMEMWETAIVERNMGNRYAIAPIYSCEYAIRELCSKLDKLSGAAVPGPVEKRIMRHMVEDQRG